MAKLTMTEEHPTPIEEKYLEGGRQGWPLILSGLKTLVRDGPAPAELRATAAERGGNVTLVPSGGNHDQA
jgi:hypothetical protein